MVPPFFFIPKFLVGLEIQGKMGISRITKCIVKVTYCLSLHPISAISTEGYYT